ncbi:MULTISPECIES: hypothetical protein [unclassified Streptomyces]|uniref:Uncharacterized protein n=1 Tax=Streptomyces evansiae TaxID=3075535 RepID=A0ABD5E4F2_9ACTN|nr:MULTISPECIES: hypothetical protein [unclassified Streptomyces]MDT0416195.1 hypothetical protein [Streptomyces sp. DSM 41982]MDT0424300.1 hypothetical protein [Streptomyces sp. DSM 41859]MYX22238.1 hypothetical protein [Streptomyces sp. SID8380]SCF46549.1 hypothetical protein GA0115257_118526 [Streptomyces sp. LcepLS]
MASATCPCGGTFSTGDPGPGGEIPELVHRDALNREAPCPLETPATPARAEARAG